MALELLATCIASSDLAVDDVGQVWQLLLDPTKEHLGGGVPVEDGIELAAEHSVCASGRDVAVRVSNWSRFMPQSLPNSARLVECSSVHCKHSM